MVKLIVLALGVCAATLAGGYAQKQFVAAPTEHITEGGHGAQSADQVPTETDLLALPVIGNGELDGFFFLRLAYTSNPAASPVSTDLLVTDGFYRFAAGAPEAEPDGFRKIDVDGVAEGIKSAVNALSKKTVISDIFVTQIDYFAGADVRKKSIERRLVLKEETARKAAPVNGHAEPAEAGHAAPAH
jgi:hypothetical protein